MLGKSIKERGYTLIELMIAILLAAIVIAATMGFLFASVKSSTENIRLTQMNQEMRAVMTFMLDEVRRAGFAGSSGDPDMMNELEWVAGSSCLKYAYQTNAASTAVASNTMAFKHVGNEIRYIGPGGNCGNAGQALNDTGVVRITSMTISNVTTGASPINFPVSSSVAIPTLKITLQGEMDNPATTRLISDVVRLRNEAPQ